MKRTIPGKYVPNGTFSSLWQCDCGFEGTTGTWKAHDGEEGTWCYACAKREVKSPLRTIQVENETYVKGYTEVLCCGHWLRCEGFTTTCEHCGSDFNWNGTRLAPREQWGEETGETATDILNYL